MKTMDRYRSKTDANTVKNGNWRCCAFYGDVGIDRFERLLRQFEDRQPTPLSET